MRAAKKTKMAGLRARKFFRKNVRYDHMILAFLAVLIGLAVGYATILFREAIATTQLFAYGTADERLLATVQQMPWWQLLAVPIVGGLIVGLIQKFLAAGKKPASVADVIEANALRDGKLDWRTGLTSMVATSLSLGVGASAGREGPAVHMGATIASFFAQRLGLSATISRTLLACGVASAVASSFNAPIAGVFFALEVVMGHYALHTFAPVVIAGVTGTIVTRVHIGDFPAFIVPDTGGISSFFELPAFAGLGLLAAVGAILFTHTLVKVGDLSHKTKIPPWLLPPVGGLLVGLIALQFPEVLGSGYEATDNALQGNYELGFLLTLFLVKIIATAITTGFNFGGGVFGPSLFLGAMLGGAYGTLTTALFPDLGSSIILYSMVGMGAMGSAVLGAPISTILIIFELTGDYQVTIAVMVASAIASLATGLMHRTSYFYWVLERRGLHLAGGKANYLLKTTLVKNSMDRHIMTVRDTALVAEVRDMLLAQYGGKLVVTDDSGLLVGVITASELISDAINKANMANPDHPLTADDICQHAPYIVAMEDSLETTMELFEKTGETEIPVVNSYQEKTVVGMIHMTDVLTVYNQALLENQEQNSDLKKRLTVKK